MHVASHHPICGTAYNFTSPEMRYFFFSSRRRHTRCLNDWSSAVCSSDLLMSFLQRHRLHRSRLHVYRMLGLVGQMGSPILHLSDAGVAVMRSAERRVG